MNGLSTTAHSLLGSGSIVKAAEIMRSRKADAMLSALGPIDLVGQRATLAAGYSLLELERANLTLKRAGRLGIPIDPARTTAVGVNVMRLRHLTASR